jgi:polysaccharide export outer membrane protein
LDHKHGARQNAEVSSRKMLSVMKKNVFVIMLVLLFTSSISAADYLIGEGDMLMISVWGEKELTLSVKVRPDGKITIPAVGELTAANMTASRLQSILTEKLGSIVKKPIVSVSVTEITNNKAYVFGGGVKSGVFALNQRTTLLQLLCQTEDARKSDLKKAYVLRGGKKVREDFTKLFIKGDAEEDIIIEPNDVIYIPMNIERNVYVMGAVNTPKFIEHREGITVMEAILDAGGFTKYASPNDTTIYRKENNKDISIHVKIKRLMYDGDLTQNVMLKPGDYVVVKEGMF